MPEIPGLDIELARMLARTTLGAMLFTLLSCYAYKIATDQYFRSGAVEVLLAVGVVAVCAGAALGLVALVIFAFFP